MFTLKVYQPLMSIQYPVYSLRMWFYCDSFDFFDDSLTSAYVHSTSAITPVHWKSQRTVVRSLVQAEPLSISNVLTGLSSFPIRGVPSTFIPRHGSLVFHPTEMLYALG